MDDTSEEIVILSDDEDIRNVIEQKFEEVKPEREIPAIKLVRDCLLFSFDALNVIS